jgi:hypothetical protein
MNCKARNWNRLNFHGIVLKNDLGREVSGAVIVVMPSFALLIALRMHQCAQLWPINNS